MRVLLNVFIALLFSGLWFVADFFSKIWAVQHLGGVRTINDFLNLRVVYNKGAAFGLLSAQDGWQIWLFAGLAIAVGLWIIWELIFSDVDFWGRFGYASILGGAAGNLYDRLTRGSVVDFIQLHYQNHYFPVFNVADVAITLGAIILVVSIVVNWFSASLSATSVSRR